MPRKTIDVALLCDWVNTRLACPDSTHHDHLNDLTPQQAFRLGTASLLEQILHASGNYKGFSYLPSEWDKDKPSEHIVNGKATTYYGGLRDGYDETRRSYRTPDTW